MTLPGVDNAPDPESRAEARVDDLAMDLTVLGEPVPWAAKSTNRRTGNRFIAPRQESAIGRVLDAVERKLPDVRLPDGVPLLMEAVFYVARPKTHYGTGRNAELLKASAPRYPTGRPDFTNLVKLIEDALVLSGILPDDDQVIGHYGESRKVYAARGETPRSVVRLYFA